MSEPDSLSEPHVSKGTPDVGQRNQPDENSDVEPDSDLDPDSDHTLDANQNETTDADAESALQPPSEGGPGTDVTPSLELRTARKVYDGDGGRVVALDDVAFAAFPGEFVAVVGPSGSGKSTLLNVLGLLDDPTAGDRFLEGTEVTKLDEAQRTAARKRSIGFVFQDFHLLPTLTALENVALPTAFDDGDASARAADLLGRFGLADRTSHTPNELSGGQKQRVAIARGLINEPAVLLADEPTGNLDTDTGMEILAEFNRICEDGVAVIAVTHDPLVEEYADRVIELTDGVVSDNSHPFIDTESDSQSASAADTDSSPDSTAVSQGNSESASDGESGAATNTDSIPADSGAADSPADESSQPDEGPSQLDDSRDSGSDPNSPETTPRESPADGEHT